MEAPLKKILRALSLELRHTLEGSYEEDGTWNAGDLERRLNQIGIWRDEDRKPKPISEMPNLSPVDRKARELIDAYLSLRSDAGVSQSDAVAEFIRESAYSWANRLFALRCIEARGIIDPVILQEETYHGRSMVHDRFAQTNPTQCTDEDDGLFAMLSEEFREHSQKLPDLFAPDSPAVALRLSIVALKHCIALLSGSVPANGGRATDEVFTAPDAFGWAYQYWNAEEKDRVFEMVRTKKGAKIEGSDIIPATQLYTEPYMVKFLVQNSLGATWMMMHPESKISTAWEYYVKDADRTPNEKKPVVEITFLDPACGSGHFLIEAFDLLYTMYEEEGQLKDPAAICQSILNKNLFGIDIDERAVQITKAVLWMKAAETVFAKTKQQLTGDNFSEFHENIIATNIRLPNGKDHVDAFLKKHPEDAPLRPALLTVFEGLQNVHELGSLVQIEEPVEKELKVLKDLAKQQKFDLQSGEIVERVNFPRWKQQVMKRLKAHFQDEAQKALPTEAFFSQSAVKGLALFDLLSYRYDVIAGNPPFLSVKNQNNLLKNYLSQNYALGKRDLYSSFLLMAKKVCKNNGYISLLTPQQWLFLRQFAGIRDFLIKHMRMEIICHLGHGAFSSTILIFIAMSVLRNTEPNKKNKIWALRLVNYSSYEEKKLNLLNSINNSKKGKIFRVVQYDLISIPESPLCYWLPQELLAHLSKSSRLISVAEVCQGLATTNNERFVRNIWEIKNNKRWQNYVKGGPYRKWVDNPRLFVDWEFNGSRLKETVITIPGNKHWSRRVANYQKYFLPGLTYTLYANGSLGTRLLNNSIFDVASISIFSEKVDRIKLGAFLNSRLVSALLRATTQDLKFHAGYLQNLPLPKNEINQIDSKIVELVISIKKRYISKEIQINDYFADMKENKNQTIKQIITDIQHEEFIYASILHTLEYYLDCFSYSLYQFSDEIQKFLDEDIGPLAGSFVLIKGYNGIPLITNSKKESYNYSDFDSFKFNQTSIIQNIDIKNLKQSLHEYYIKGSNSRKEIENNDDCEKKPSEEYDLEDSINNYSIGFPTETFLEELSQKIKIHPISIYWLLKEGIEKDGWRCIPEEKRYTEDLFTMMVLRLLGHRWPKQIEAGEPVPELADTDGIIPITSGLTLPTLLQQVRDRIVTEFPGGKVHEIEKEFEEIVGISLERWLTGEFFKHHISQFKKRPIAWQLSSSPSGTVTGRRKGRGSRGEPAFSCLIYYHKIDADILHKIRTQYIGDLINRYGTELRALEGRKELTADQASREVQLENWIDELKDFSQALQDVADTGFDSVVLNEIVKKESLDKWTSRDGKSAQPKSAEEFYAQEKRYNPDINDGVRVNIAPLQKIGLLAAEVIAKKDVEKAIADHAEWRADERRWCREGKLPKNGWWE